jgi:hypothetical protein
MFPWTQLFIDLAILIAVFTAFVLGTLLWKPRIWLHDFPADIQALAAPKTPAEERLTKLLGIPFMLLFFGLPLLLAWDLKSIFGADYSFLNAWLYGYALFFGVNLWDLIVLDWIGFALVDPQNPPFPGTEGARGYRDYAFHFYGFLKGCLIGLVFATFFAGVITALA